MTAKPVLALRLVLLVVALSFLSPGCTATITPPEHPVHPVAVFVADYGHHSSVFLPEEKKAFIEYSFGDWNYYALNHSSIAAAIEALFYSQGSAFGRRYTPRSGDQGAPIPFGTPRVFSICVSRDDVDRVRTQLELRWQQNQSTLLHNQWDDTDFVRDDRRYGWTRDCNEATASILRDLGCAVEGGVTSRIFGYRKIRKGRWIIASEAWSGLRA